MSLDITLEHITDTVIESNLAAAAGEELLQSVLSAEADLLTRPASQPWILRSPTLKTREAVVKISEKTDWGNLATLINVRTEDVKARWTGGWPLVFLLTSTQPFVYRPGRSDRIFSYVALAPANYDNGLPALGDARVRFSLHPGEAVHVLGDVVQYFSGRGGGTALLLVWKLH